MIERYLRLPLVSVIIDAGMVHGWSGRYASGARALVHSVSKDVRHSGYRADESDVLCDLSLCTAAGFAYLQSRKLREDSPPARPPTWVPRATVRLVALRGLCSGRGGPRRQVPLPSRVVKLHLYRFRRSPSEWKASGFWRREVRNLQRSMNRTVTVVSRVMCVHCLSPAKRKTEKVQISGILIQQGVMNMFKLVLD